MECWEPAAEKTMLSRGDKLIQRLQTRLHWLTAAKQQQEAGLQKLMIN